jgi:hypothetical protein
MELLRDLFYFIFAWCLKTIAKKRKHLRGALKNKTNANAHAQNPPKKHPPTSVFFLTVFY